MNMISIVRATDKDAALLSEIGKTTFIESHGRSAAEEDITEYIENTYNVASMQKELLDSRNIYHVLYLENEPVGFSKILLNTPFDENDRSDIGKLERIFLLAKVHDRKLGAKLLDFSINYLKNHQQSGVWLFVWTENYRALKFYDRNGFQIAGSHNFRISKNHSNPNYRMSLNFGQQ